MDINPNEGRETMENRLAQAEYRLEFILSLILSHLEDSDPKEAEAFMEKWDAPP